jgi:hypothetical protein
MGRRRKHRNITYELEEVRKKAKSEARRNCYSDFFEFLAESLSEAEIRRGIDEKAVKDLGAFCRRRPAPLTVRAFSVVMFGDAKRIHRLARLFEPLFRRARRYAIVHPDCAITGPKYPETIAAGNIRFVLSGGTVINAAGGSIGLPIDTVLKIIRVEPTVKTRARMKILTVENKESFYTLFAEGKKSLDFDLFLYTGGYPNSALLSLLELLAFMKCRFFHAGDLDPDGILILEQIFFAAGRRVTPLKMDAESFDLYRPWSRRLCAAALDSISRISKKTRALPGIESLIARIKKTGRGLDQEIIDYR